MQKLQGIAVSPGVAIGEALVMDNEGFRIPRRFVSRDAVEDELERLDAAMRRRRRRDRPQSRRRRPRARRRSTRAIFDAHLQMLRDPRLRSEVEAMIRDQHYSPEYAVSRTLRRYAKVFQERAEQLLRRAGHRHLRHREAAAAQPAGPAPRGAVARSLRRSSCWRTTSRPAKRPTSTASFVRGFVTEIGGPGSHTAIVAEGMEIPAVVGIGPFLTDVSGGDLVIIDGDHGLVILQPDEETIARYRHEAEQQKIGGRAARRAARPAGRDRRRRAHRAAWATSSSPTKSTTASSAAATASACIAPSSCTWRSSTSRPKKTHYDAYARVVQAMGDRPVVIRTLDLGADKLADLRQPEDERNPFLGLRSIRLSLRNLPLFRTQLRAILRASALGNVRVMFPLISTLLELRQAKMVLADVMEDLEEHGIAFNRKLPIGMMVEVPAAVMMIDHFVEEVDFFSIGTNDLIQYTLAVDRTNKDVAALYNSCDPAVLRLIEMSLRAAAAGRVSVNVCGQMSSSIRYTQLLLGMGLRTFSVTPSAIPEIKRVCRLLRIDQCQAIAQRALYNSRTLATLRTI